MGWLRWKWLRFWGRYYRIFKTDRLKHNEIIVKAHRIYVPESWVFLDDTRSKSN